MQQYYTTLGVLALSKIILGHVVGEINLILCKRLTSYLPLDETVTFNVLNCRLCSANNLIHVNKCKVL